MTMTRIQEGDLQFDFPPGWAVRRLDNDPYQSEFQVLRKNIKFPDEIEKFLAFEKKNKIIHWNDNPVRTLSKLARDGIKAVDIVAVNPERSETWLIEIKDYRNPRADDPLDNRLDQVIARKVSDSLGCLAAARIRAEDEAMRTFAALALGTENLRIVFHLESRLQDDQRGEIYTALNRRLNSVDPSAHIAWCAMPEFPFAWRVIDYKAP